MLRYLFCVLTFADDDCIYAVTVVHVSPHGSYVPVYFFAEVSCWFVVAQKAAARVYIYQLLCVV